MVIPYPQGTDPNNYPGQMQALATALDSICVVYLEGTFAARPSPATHGRLYLATDTGAVYYDTSTSWVLLNTNPAATATAKGDLLAASAPSVLARLGVGTDGQSLTALSSATLGVQWQSVLGMPLALSGAGSSTRYVGGTASGPPSSGTFAAGDYVVTGAGRVWVCTTGGTPGTWAQAGANNVSFRREQTAGQSIPNNTGSPGTFTVVSFNIAASDDTDGGWGSSATTYTVPVAGLWELTYSATISASTSTGGMIAAVLRNGTGIPGSGDGQAFNSNATLFYAGRVVRQRCAVGDTLQLGLLQNSGSARNTAPSAGFGEGVVFSGELVHS